MGIDEEEGRAVTIKQIKKDVYGAGDIGCAVEEEVGLLRC